MSEISNLKIYRCKFPLRFGYRLSYGTIEYFDTILIELEDREGKSHWGEATFLPGYSNEDPDMCFNQGVAISKELIKLETSSASEIIKQYNEEFPFLTSAFITAFEGVNNKYTYQKVKVPVIGLVNEIKAQEVQTAVENIVEAGCTAVKTKLGTTSMKDDLKKVQLIDKCSNRELKIRVDANQALENENIDKIINAFSGLNIQYLEQPFKRDNFDKHKELNEKAPFPIMLDESVWNFQDIDVVYENSIADYIKLKLQKCRGPTQFEAMINYIQERNINIIIGNGVQTDLNCILEAVSYDKCKLTEAAENIGFIKLKTPITKNEIAFENGYIVTVDKPIEIEPKMLDKYSIRKSDIN